MSEQSKGLEAARSPAFEELFLEHFSYVLHCLRRSGVGEGDLDDVAQDVFISVHRHFSKYDAARPIRAWLFTFAAQAAANYRRLARHRREGALSEATAARTELGPDADLDRSRQLEWIQGVLGQMSDDRRNALIMHDLDGFTAPEIAEVLGVPLNTVYSRVRRAREAFRKVAQASPMEPS